MLLGLGPSDAMQGLDAVNEQDVHLAQQYLSTSVVQDIFPDFFDFELDVVGCHNVLRCCRGKAKLTNWMKASPFLWCYAISTMETFLKNFRLCQTCCRLYIKRYSEGRQKIWDDLPEQFSLPPWTTLEGATDCLLSNELLVPGRLKA
ncbi:hypothetical protein EIP86_002165 [Pleurotus ostreatoroseus]|nr:hypothetical protein EIP86_002165 [Pleurotus ostreatoroseus]